MKIYIELPDNIFDIDHADLTALINLKDTVARKLEKAICDYYLSRQIMPEIEIDKAEVKARIIDLMAERVLNKLD